MSKKPEKPSKRARRQYVQALNQLQADSAYHEDLGRWPGNELPEVGDVVQIRGREFTVTEIVNDDDVLHGQRHNNLVQIFVSENVPDGEKLTEEEAKVQKLRVVRARNKHLREAMKKVNLKINRGGGNG